MGKIIERARRRERARQVNEAKERHEKYMLAHAMRQAPGEVSFVPTCGTEAARLLEKMNEAGSLIGEVQWVPNPADFQIRPWWAFWRR